MKKILPFLLLFGCFNGFAQIHTDTLAFQNFDTIPFVPTWNFKDSIVYDSGYSAPNAAPPSSDIGIGGSRAWKTVSISNGQPLELDNVSIPPGYDSLRVRFRLAAMNLGSSSGGPDALDYVRTQISLDSGQTYYNRLIIRGAVNNNSFWAYSATAVAKLDYMPATEVSFQPVNSGLQTTEGFSTCEIVFPGSIPRLRIKIIARSSSGSDVWLVDNVMLTGEYLITSANDVSKSSGGIRIAPNPFSANATLKFSDPKFVGSKALVQIFDVLGNEVRRREVTVSPSIPIDRANLPDGIYFIRVTTADGVGHIVKAVVSSR